MLIVRGAMDLDTLRILGMMYGSEDQANSIQANRAADAAADRTNLLGPLKFPQRVNMTFDNVRATPEQIHAATQLVQSEKEHVLQLQLENAKLAENEALVKSLSAALDDLNAKKMKEQGFDDQTIRTITAQTKANRDLTEEIKKRKELEDEWTKAVDFGRNKFYPSNILTPGGPDLSGPSAAFTRDSAAISRVMIQAMRAAKQDVLEEAIQQATEEAQARDDSYLAQRKKGELKNDTEMNTLIAENHQALLDKLQSLNEQYGTDLSNILLRLSRSYGTNAQQIETLTKSIGNSITTNLGTAFFSALTGNIQGVKDAFKSLAQSILQEITKLMAQKIVQAFISMYLGGLPTSSSVNGMSQSYMAGLIGAHASGGILSGGFTAFSSGGIATQPTLGLVGEGKYNEAVVPLPNGRSIPVDMRGQKSELTQNLTIMLSPGFLAGIRPFMQPSPGEIIAVINEDLVTNGKLRHVIKSFI